VHDLFGRVLGQVELVEACVARGQALLVGGTYSFDIEQLDSMHTLERFEAVKGYLGTAGDEEEEKAHI
jgi:hypothetical protein